MQDRIFIDEKIYLKLVKKSDAEEAFCVIDKIGGVTYGL